MAYSFAAKNFLLIIVPFLNSYFTDPLSLKINYFLNYKMEIKKKIELLVNEWETELW